MTESCTAPRPIEYLDVSDITRQRTGLRYTAPDGSPRRFDLYYPPSGNGPFPLLINISGGAWFHGHTTSVHLGRMVHTSIARGYAVASLACTSSQHQKFPYQILEANRALRHLLRHAQELELDPDFFAFWSSSSGAHLSLMTALTQGDPYFGSSAGGPVRLSAVVAIYPCCQVGASAEDFHAIGLEPAFLCSGPDNADSIFLGVPVEEHPELRRLASPISHIHPDAPPVLLMHGTADRVIPYTFSAAFARRYCEIAGPERIQTRFIPGAGHSDPQFKSDETCHEILDFLDRVRASQAPR